MKSKGQDYMITDNAFDLDHYFVIHTDDGKTKVEHTKDNPALLEVPKSRRNKGGLG